MFIPRLTPELVARAGVTQSNACTNGTTPGGSVLRLYLCHLRLTIPEQDQEDDGGHFVAMRFGEAIGPGADWVGSRSETGTPG
jgi:hypothetical protein